MIQDQKFESGENFKLPTRMLGLEGIGGESLVAHISIPISLPKQQSAIPAMK